MPHSNGATVPGLQRMHDLGALHALAAFNISVALVSDHRIVIETCRQVPDAFDHVFRIGRGGSVTFHSTQIVDHFMAILERALGAAGIGAPTWVSDVFSEPVPNRSPLLIRLLAQPRVNDLAVLITVVDLEQRPTIPALFLRTAYGLTSAEALLAVRLANGGSLTDICSEGHIQISTGRSQLAGVLAKTGTSRQSHLVSLLVRLSLPVIAQINESSDFSSEHDSSATRDDR